MLPHSGRPMATFAGASALHSCLGPDNAAQLVLVALGEKRQGTGGKKSIDLYRQKRLCRSKSRIISFGRSTEDVSYPSRRISVLEATQTGQRISRTQCKSHSVNLFPLGLRFQRKLQPGCGETSIGPDRRLHKLQNNAQK